MQLGKKEKKKVEGIGKNNIVMSGRSNWKGLFLAKKFISKAFKNRIWMRSTKLVKLFLNKKLYVYNGFLFYNVTCSRTRMNEACGNYSFTKKRGIAMHERIMKKKSAKKGGKRSSKKGSKKKGLMSFFLYNGAGGICDVCNTRPNKKLA